MLAHALLQKLVPRDSLIFFALLPCAPRTQRHLRTFCTLQERGRGPAHFWARPACHAIGTGSALARTRELVMSEICLSKKPVLGLGRLRRSKREGIGFRAFANLKALQEDCPDLGYSRLFHCSVAHQGHRMFRVCGQAASENHVQSLAP